LEDDGGDGSGSVDGGVMQGRGPRWGLGAGREGRGCGIGVEGRVGEGAPGARDGVKSHEVKR
jgi:hypothetical protein